MDMLKKPTHQKKKNPTYNQAKLAFLSTTGLAFSEDQYTLDICIMFSKLLQKHGLIRANGGQFSFVGVHITINMKGPILWHKARIFPLNTMYAA